MISAMSGDNLVEKVGKEENKLYEIDNSGDIKWGERGLTAVGFNLIVSIFEFYGAIFFRRRFLCHSSLPVDVYLP
jgi:hypothetical protein